MKKGRPNCKLSTRKVFQILLKNTDRLKVREWGVFYCETTNERKAPMSVLYRTKQILQQGLLPAMKKIIITIKGSSHQ